MEWLAISHGCLSKITNLGKKSCWYFYHLWSRPRTFQTIDVHPGLVSSHNSMEKSISFMSMTVQMLLTNRLPRTLVIIGHLPWDRSATHFYIPEVIMVYIVRRAMNRVQFYGNFINSGSSVVTDSLLDLLFDCLSCYANWFPTSVFITDVFSSDLKPFYSFIHSPLTQTTVSILNLRSSVDFRTFHTLWPQKNFSMHFRIKFL